MRDVDFKERRKRFLDENDDVMFKCGCDSKCEDRIHMVGECPLYDLMEKIE